MQSVRLAHFFSAFQSLGGVQSVLRHQLDRDPAHGLQSELLVYFEKETERFDRVHYVGPTPCGSIRAARRRVRRVLANLRPEVAAYHGLWGIQHFADLDGAARRIHVIHGDGPGMAILPQNAPWLDGILCVSRPLQARVRSMLSHWDPERVGLLPYPIQPPVEPSFARPPIRGRPLVIGFAGRLEKLQKRVERFPELISQLDKTGTPFRFELLGGGEDRAWLEAQFANNPRVRFHGQKTGLDYWRVLQGWDVIVFVSDYEGLPIAMLEALALGVIPVFPEIKSGGDDYAGRIDAGLLYPPAGLAEAAACIARISRMGEAEIEHLRSQCRTVVAPHLGDGYIETFSAFVRKLLEMPRIADEKFPSRSWFRDACPLAAYDKFRAVKRRLAGH